MFLGDSRNRMGAVGKERVVEIRNNEAYRSAALTAKGAGQLIGPVLQLLNRSVHPLRGLFRNGHRAAENTRNGHGADTSQSRHVAHGGFAGRLPGSLSDTACGLILTRVRQFTFSRDTQLAIAPNSGKRTVASMRDFSSEGHKNTRLKRKRRTLYVWHVIKDGLYQLDSDRGNWRAVQSQTLRTKTFMLMDGRPASGRSLSESDKRRRE